MRISSVAGGLLAVWLGLAGTFPQGSGEGNGGSGGGFGMAGGHILANPFRVKGRDREDDSAQAGLALRAEDGRAFLYLLCDEDDDNPHIVYSGGARIDAHTQPVKVQYSVDGGPPVKHWFIVNRGGKTALYFPRYNRMYWKRLGRNPEIFDKETGGVGADYITWYDNTYNIVIADFASGRWLDFTLWDGAGERHDHRFDISGMKNALHYLSVCVEPPLAEKMHPTPDNPDVLIEGW